MDSLQGAMEPEQIAALLRADWLVPDDEFDRVLPSSAQLVSRRFWTPVGVARRAARWLFHAGARSVLDVGSGVGKFCVVGALTTPLRFEGIEQRPHLVEAAGKLAARFNVAAQTTFLRGDFTGAAESNYDAIYFYNPFEENVLPRLDQLDHSVELSETRHRRDLAAAEQLLARVAVGTWMVTYHCFGGSVPDSFELVQARPAGQHMLRLWRKVRPEARGGTWIERRDSTTLRGANALRALPRWERLSKR
jgi:hypothetical protein